MRIRQDFAKSKRCPGIEGAHRKRSRYVLWPKAACASLLILFVLTAPIASVAEIYKWTDEDGKSLTLAEQGRRVEEFKAEAAEADCPGYID